MGFTKVEYFYMCIKRELENSHQWNVLFGPTRFVKPVVVFPAGKGLTQGNTFDNGFTNMR